MTASERIREARENACARCSKPATHLSGVGNGNYELHRKLCPYHTNMRHAENPATWSRSI